MANNPSFSLNKLRIHLFNSDWLYCTNGCAVGPGRQRYSDRCYGHVTVAISVGTLTLSLSGFLPMDADAGHDNRGSSVQHLGTLEI